MEILEAMTKIDYNRFVSHTTKEPWGGSIYLMERNGKAFVRMYWYDDDGTTIYLAGLSVSAEARKQGLATELLEMCENIGVTLCATMLGLVVQKNTWMKDWYKRRGYEEVDPKVENEENTIWMKKVLVNNM